MNDRNMIPDIANYWQMACRAYPEQRAGQVFYNAIGDPFHISCQDIIDHLNAYATRGFEDQKVRKVAQAIAQASRGEGVLILSEWDLKAARAAIEVIEGE